MSVRSNILKAAMIGLSLGATVAPAKDSAMEPKKDQEKCWGVNKCAAHTKCGVSKSDIEATKEVFKDKFAKTETHDCAGAGKCAAEKGQLGWTEVAKGTCKKEGGFMIEKKGDKKVVVK